MLSEAQLKRHLQDHFDAERARDVDWIVDTISEHAEYYVVGPHYPDDPVRKKATAEGREAVRQLWINYFSKFSSYDIQCREEDMLAFPERNIVWAQVSITATPAQDFEGFPAGKPFCYRTAALCHFDDDGKLTKETVYGSLGQVLMDFRRMRDFLAERGQGLKR
jgi:hypothetical protein